MMNALFKSTMLDKYGSSLETAEHIWKLGQPLVIPAKTTICFPNTINDDVYFIESGAIKQYTHSPTKKERVMRFFTKGDFFSCNYIKFFSEQKTRVFSDTITEVKAYKFSVQDLVSLGDRHLSYYAFHIRFLLKEYSAIEEKEYRQIQLSSTERYAYFREQYPEIADKVTAKSIASYLQIHPGSLSRIKHKLNT